MNRSVPAGEYRSDIETLSFILRTIVAFAVLAAMAWFNGFHMRRCWLRVNGPPRVARKVRSYSRMEERDPIGYAYLYLALGSLIMLGLAAVAVFMIYGLITGQAH